MMKIIIILLILYTVRCELSSPCPHHILYYEPTNDTDRWYAVVNLNSKTKLYRIWLNIKLDKAAHLLGNAFGDVSSRNNTEFFIKNENYLLEAGSMKPVRFFVKHDPSTPPPNVAGISLNGRSMCSSSAGVPETGEDLHDIPVDDSNASPVTRAPTVAGPAYYDNRPPDNGKEIVDTQQITGEELLTLYQTIFTTSRPRGLAEPSLNENYQCGTVDVGIPLIYGGVETKHVKWPWHAAIYRSSGVNPSYQCAGSLISKRHILTVAHCVIRKKEYGPRYDKIKPENFLIVLGQTNLGEFGPLSQERSVSDISIHEGFNAEELDNDIAIASLTVPVDITAQVRPVCLCDGTDEEFTGKIGTVVGWGRWGPDFIEKISRSLKQVQMPVHDIHTCLSSRNTRRYLTSKTFCAGYRNGSSVCNGDSGGGMVFQKVSDSYNVWELGGLVSIGLSLPGTDECDPKEFVIFTNIAKHLEWIRNIIETPS